MTSLQETQSPADPDAQGEKIAAQIEMAALHGRKTAVQDEQTATLGKQPTPQGKHIILFEWHLLYGRPLTPHYMCVDDFGHHPSEDTIKHDDPQIVLGGKHGEAA